MTTTSVKITAGTYTKLNTVTTAYIVQNTTGKTVEFVLMDSQPTDNTKGNILLPNQAISSSDFPGTVWAKPQGTPGAEYNISVNE